MKVCFLSTTPIPTARLIARQCLSIARKGISVVLVAPLHLNIESNNFTVVRFPCAKGPISRIVCSLVTLFVALRIHADVYHLHGFPLVFSGLILKRVFRKRVVYDMFEDFPAMAFACHSVPRWMRGSCRKLTWICERLACKSFDAIISADAAVIRTYVRNARPIGSARRRVFYNFPAHWFCKAHNARRVFDDKAADFVYCGGLSERTGLMRLVEAVQELVRAGIRPTVLLFGYPDNKQFLDRFHDVISKFGLKGCFRLLGRVAPFDVPAYMLNGRIGLVPLQPVPKFLKNLPTKLFEYWACGLPVICSDLPPARIFFHDGIAGHLFKAESSHELAAAMKRLLNDPAKAERMGRAGRRMIRLRMHAESEQDRLLSLYSTVCEQ